MSNQIIHAFTTDIGRRSIQQDDYCISKIWEGKGTVFGIFDGHGANGHKAAAYAKTQFPILIDQVKDQILSDPNQTLKEIFSQINEGMNSDSKIDTYMSGTTAGVVIIYEDDIISANVGDTRIVLVDTKGIPNPISIDHTCEVPEEYERVINHGGRIEQMKIDGVPEGPKRVYKGSLPYPGLVVSRALGDACVSKNGILCEPHIHRVKIDKSHHSFIIIGSDGLWDGIGLKESVSLVQPYIDIDLQLASNILNDAGLAGLDKIQIDDNITNILISFK